MGSFLGYKKEDELVLLFDIGSSSVGGVSFRLGKDNVPKIISSIREPIDIDMTVDPDKFLTYTLKSLAVVVNKMHSSGLGMPSRIFCVLSAPWHVSQTRTIRFEKNSPFIFTAKLADSLIEKEIKLFEEEYVAKYQEMGSPVRSIEFKNIKTVLNGYETASPVGQSAEELEMTIFISISPEQVLAKIEESIQKSFHAKSVRFVSFTMASFAVVRDMYVSQENFILIDIGGEVSNISMVKKNILRESISFPLGTNFVMRGIASELGATLDEARSFVSLYKDGHASKPVEAKLQTALDKLKHEWLENFQKSLPSLSNDISIPSTIYITVERELADFFIQTIQNEQFNQYTFAESKFIVNFLGIETFHGMATFAENAVRDVSLVVDAVYVNRFFSKK